MRDYLNLLSSCYFTVRHFSMFKTLLPDKLEYRGRGSVLYVLDLV